MKDPRYEFERCINGDWYQHPTTRKERVNASVTVVIEMSRIVEEASLIHYCKGLLAGRGYQDHLEQVMDQFYEQNPHRFFNLVEPFSLADQVRSDREVTLDLMSKLEAHVAQWKPLESVEPQPAISSSQSTSS